MPTVIHSSCETLLDQQEVAELLGVSVSCLRWWRKRRLGPKYVAISPKVLRYRKSSLLEYIESREMRAAA